MANYIPEDDLDAIFDYIGQRYGRIEQVPTYKAEPRLDEFCGVLRLVKSDTYYPSIYDKATYLIIGINKGHFFSNGNKRLALVMTTVFFLLNGLVFKKKDKVWYQAVLSGIFPEYDRWDEDFPDFSATDFATYHLSIMIADSGRYDITHEELKERVYDFFTESTEPEVM